MRSLAFLLLLAPGLSVAAPAPVLATIDHTRSGGSLRLHQDACYSWGDPNVEVGTSDLRVSQTVTSIAGCTTTSTQQRTIFLSNTLAVGSYRVIYTPVAVGFDAMPVSVVEFTVRPLGIGPSLDIEPFHPVALEPIQAHFDIADTCEWVSGFRVVNGGFRIELASDYSNPLQCDGILGTSVTIGAFPPGSYRVELARPPSEGGEVMSFVDFVVRPGTSAYPSSRRTPQPDFSGLWYSPNEEPFTGMSIIQSRQPPAEGSAARPNVVTGVWYRFSEAGDATWYIVEAVNSGFENTYRGAIYEYVATNPTAPAWQLAANATPIGTITFNFGSLDRATRVEAVLNGKPLQFMMQRFRWPRSAWPSPLAP